ncbi:NAD(P)-dependent oxidoreductase [Rhodococcus artemisiae]|uniref:NAD(P)-dependent oxidoreductase n=1 Tax=Rhodococcus artemisiae TaxID=714159 RepID=A0ABU7LGD1_9NOCA|nr:NAD(P)-dependent oxidoreductase [Rhodococcus artemisiae]MEE2060620.1 NAD(P)-dependent oxidoreductase [Rhodococcus artemisiae]
MTTRIGYIGLGNMGAPMALRLLDHIGSLSVLDTNPDAVTPFIEAGARPVSNAAELASVSDIVCVTVLDDAQVRDVVAGPDGLLSTAKPGTVIAVHSTISDTTALDLETQCASHGVEFVDAPVSGGAAGAKKAALAVMVGASDEAFEKIREPFRAFAALVVHAGPVGAGTRMKLARNLLHFVSFTAATEAQRLAEAAGIDITELGKVVRHTDSITGGAGSIMWRDNTSALEPDDSWFPIFSHVRALGEKDLALAMALGDRLDVDLPLATRALAGLGPGLGVGIGDIARTHSMEEQP